MIWKAWEVARLTKNNAKHMYYLTVIQPQHKHAKLYNKTNPIEITSFLWGGTKHSWVCQPYPVGIVTEVEEVRFSHCLIPRVRDGLCLTFLRWYLPLFSLSLKREYYFLFYKWNLSLHIFVLIGAKFFHLPFKGIGQRFMDVECMLRKRLLQLGDE